MRGEARTLGGGCGERGVELPADHVERAKAGSPFTRAPERARRIGLHDRGFGARVLDEVGNRVVGEARVDHDHHRANLEDAEQGADEPGSVVQREDHPLLRLDAGVRDHAPVARGERGDLRVGPVPFVGAKRDPAAAPLAEPGVQEPVGHVELFRRLERHGAG